MVQFHYFLKICKFELSVKTDRCRLSVSLVGLKPTAVGLSVSVVGLKPTHVGLSVSKFFSAENVLHIFVDARKGQL